MLAKQGDNRSFPHLAGTGQKNDDFALDNFSPLIPPSSFLMIS